jgi:hypothetical protein
VYVVENITCVYAQRNHQVLIFTAYTKQHIHVMFAVIFSYSSIQTINSSNKDEKTTHNKNKLNMLELCPRGNNKDVIIIILVHDNVYIPC